MDADHSFPKQSRQKQHMCKVYECNVRTALRERNVASVQRCMSGVHHVFGNSCICRTALQMDHASLLKQFEHLDPHNQNTFEAKDLELLISTVRSSS